MHRGITTFKCDVCGHTFRAMDIEWQATVYTMPVPCPNCGSRHTMPKSMFSLFTKGVYRKIWQEIDNKNEKQTIRSNVIPLLTGEKLFKR